MLRLCVIWKQSKNLVSTDPTETGFKTTKPQTKQTNKKKNQQQTDSATEYTF